MPKKGRIWIFLAVMTVMLLFISTDALPCLASEGGGITLEVSAGYDGTGIPDHFNPFRVTVRNGEADFSGELEIAGGMTSEGRCIYSAPVTIPKGSTKVYTINAVFASPDRKVPIFLTKGRRIVKSVDYTFEKLADTDDLLMGLMCDDIGGLDGLRGLTMPESGRTVSPIRLDSESFPEDPAALRPFRFLLLSNFDTSVLSDAQTSALKSWVREGGILLTGTGSSWKKVYSGLPPELRPFGIHGNNVAEDVSSLKEYTGIGCAFTKLDTATGTPGEGTVLVEGSSFPLAVSYATGGGAVTVMSFDPSADPISGWEGLQRLIGRLAESSRLLRQDTGRPLWQPVDMSVFKDVTGDLPEPGSLSFLVLFLILLFYLVVIGPCTYFFLKLGGKSHYGWLVIPLTALLFTGVVYGAGIGTRSVEAVSNSVSLIEVDNASGMAMVNMYAGLFDSRPGTVKISYDGYAAVTPENNIFYSDYELSRENKEDRILYKLSGNPVRSCEIYEVRLWEPRFLSIRDVLDTNGPILSETSAGNGKIRAVITNSTPFDFEAGFLAYRDRFARTGRLESGKKQVIELSTDENRDMTNFGGLLFAGPANGIAGSGQVAGDRLPAKWRDLISDFYRTTLNTDKDRLTYFALNSDRPVQRFRVNGREPESHNTNIIYASMELGG